METSTDRSWENITEIELIYKSKIKASERIQIKSSRAAYELVLSSWDEDKIELLEQFKILFLNNACKVLGLYEVSSGGICGTVVDLRLIFAAALKANATSLMMIHNHPSGRTHASEADRQITSKVKLAGKMLDIVLLDHLIITKETYYSFCDDGAL